MIWCSMDPSEPASNMFRNTSFGSRATSLESSIMSSPGSLDSASAGMFIFPAVWMILKL